MIDCDDESNSNNKYHRKICGTKSSKTIKKCDFECQKCKTAFSTILHQNPKTKLPAKNYCFSETTCQSPSYRKPCDFCKNPDDESDLIGCVPDAYNTLRDVKCCHHQCVGGCHGTGNQKCTACKNYYIEFYNTTKCVEKCPENWYIFGRSCIENCPDDYFKYKNKCVSKCPCGLKKFFEKGVCVELSKDEQEKDGSCNFCSVYGKDKIVTKNSIEMFKKCVENLKYPSSLKIEGDVIFNKKSAGLTLADLKSFENVTVITGDFYIKELFVLDSSHIGQVFPKLREIVGDSIKGYKNGRKILTEKTLMLEPTCHVGLSVGLSMLRTVNSGNISIGDNLCNGMDVVDKNILENPYVYGIQEIGIRDSMYQYGRLLCKKTLFDYFCVDGINQGVKYSNADPFSFYSFIENKMLKKGLSSETVCKKDDYDNSRRKFEYERKSSERKLFDIVYPVIDPEKNPKEVLRNFYKGSETCPGCHESCDKCWSSGEKHCKKCKNGFIRNLDYTCTEECAKGYYSGSIAKSSKKERTAIFENLKSVGFDESGDEMVNLGDLDKLFYEGEVCLPYCENCSEFDNSIFWIISGLVFLFIVIMVLLLLLCLKKRCFPVESTENQTPVLQNPMPRKPVSNTPELSQLENGGFKRPVVIFGAISDIAKRLLTMNYPQEYEEANVINGDQTETGAVIDNQKSFVEISTIESVIKCGRHCVLDITPNACEKLNKQRLNPIVIFLKVEKLQEVKVLRKKYQSDFPDQNDKISEKMFRRAVQFEKACEHLITSRVDVSSENNEDLFWRLQAEIRKLQNTPVRENNEIHGNMENNSRMDDDRLSVISMLDSQYFCTTLGSKKDNDEAEETQNMLSTPEQPQQKQQHSPANKQYSPIHVIHNSLQ